MAIPLLMSFGDTTHQLAVLLHQPLILGIRLVFGNQRLFHLGGSGAPETDQTQRDNNDVRRFHEVSSFRRTPGTSLNEKATCLVTATC